jgi:UDP-N-acetylglucosamine 4,6-dehydratase/5-epimerase
MIYVITGGTGSLGRALTAALMADSTVSAIRVLSRDELKQAEMATELGPSDKVRYLLGDVRDVARLTQAFVDADVVVHCAALKRVDAIAYNPWEARKTNVEGSANVITAAVACHVPRVLMISSDKAVEPTNFYGVTKALMEHEAVASNVWTVPRGTQVSCTRWGNVIESRGSVAHVFKQAVAEGRPLPITDPRCTRFWLRLGDAVSYVEEALTLMEGGEIFVPADLPSSTLEAMANQMYPGHPRETIGLRPGGEKLHETLATADELQRAVLRGPFYVITPYLHPWRERDWDSGGLVFTTRAYTSEFGS